MKWQIIHTIFFLGTLLSPSTLVEAETAKEVYGQYMTLVQEGKMSTEEYPVWADRLYEAAKSDNTASLVQRLRILDEAGALFRADGNRMKSVSVYQELYDQATKHNNVENRVIALQNLIGLCEYDKARMKDALTYYEALEGILSSPPPDKLERFGRDLVDTYNNHGMLYKRLASQRGGREDQNSRYLAESEKYLKYFIDNWRPSNINKPAVARFNLAEVYLVQGKKVKAADMYSAIRNGDNKSFSPTWIFHKELKCTHNTSSEEYRDKLQNYLEAHLQDDYYPAALQALAMSYLESRQGDKAIPLFEKLLVLTKDEGVLAYNTYLLGASYIDAGMTDRGLAILKDTMGRFPGSGGASLARKLIAWAEKSMESFEAELKGLAIAELRSLYREGIPDEHLTPAATSDSNHEELVQTKQRENNSINAGMKNHSEPDKALLSRTYTYFGVVAVIVCIIVGVLIFRARNRVRKKMSKRKTAIGGFLWLVVLGSIVAPADVLAAPKAFAQKTKVDLGSISDASPVTCEFWIKNTGTGVLRITPQKNSCNCLRFAKVSNIEIEAGGTKKIAVIFDPYARSGKFSMFSFFKTNDSSQETLKLIVAGSVVPILSISPGRLAFKIDVEDEIPVEKRVEVSSSLVDLAKVKLAQFKKKPCGVLVEHSWDTTKRKNERTLVLRFHSVRQLGMVSLEIPLQVHFNSKLYQKNIIARGVVGSRMLKNPEVYFGLISRQADALKRTLQTKGHYRIFKISNMPEYLNVKVHKNQTMAAITLVPSLIPSNVKPGIVEVPLKVHFDGEESVDVMLRYYLINLRSTPVENHGVGS